MTRRTVHESCDWATGALIYGMVIFTPWAFGTTSPWSIQIMNISGCGLGALLVVKLLIRLGGYVPDRWGTPSLYARIVTRCLVTLSIFIVLWCGISAWNASATYSPTNLQFEYRQQIRWLPHSLDGLASGSAFWNYAALACAFWALRDWLLTDSKRDLYEGSVRRRMLPVRLQTLICVVTLNGVFVGLEGILQRLDGGGKLLWVLEPPENRTASSQFGPYPYRSNAAQFFNLIWPVALGLWFILNRQHRAGSRSTHHLLLSCVMVLAACPLMTNSRAGAIVTIVCLAVSSIFLVWMFWNESWLVRLAPIFCAAAIALLGLNMEWEMLISRMATFHDNLDGREQMYDTARKIAADYPWLGTGPGTFDSIFQLYRSSPDEYWPAQLHNDWLETRITFGRIGFTLILLTLFLAGFRFLLPVGGIPVHWGFPVFLWISLGGCLLHARYDFPLQIYSVLFVFVLNCAILSCLSCKRKPSAQSSDLFYC